MSCNQESNPDCEECQKALKDHLKKCAGYGQNPEPICECADMGCSSGQPTCPAPPPPPPLQCGPPKCTIERKNFSCPASDCEPKASTCPPKPACGQKPACPPKKKAPCGPKNDNSCEVRPLCMDK